MRDLAKELQPLPCSQTLSPVLPEFRPTAFLSWASSLFRVSFPSQPLRIRWRTRRIRLCIANSNMLPVYDQNTLTHTRQSREAGLNN